MKTKAIYSPQPDEPQESAASYEYAKRISDLLGGVPGDGPTSISSSSAETDGDGEANGIVVERLNESGKSQCLDLPRTCRKLHAMHIYHILLE